MSSRALNLLLAAWSVSMASAQTTTPTLTATPAALGFTWQQGTALPAAQLVAVKSGSSTAAYTTDVVPGGAMWLSVSPDAGNLAASLSVRVNPSGLPVGTYNASVQVTVAGFANPATI